MFSMNFEGKCSFKPVSSPKLEAVLQCAIKGRQIIVYRWDLHLLTIKQGKQIIDRCVLRHCQGYIINDKKLFVKRLRPSSDAVLHMSRIECK